MQNFCDGIYMHILYVHSLSFSLTYPHADLAGSM